MLFAWLAAFLVSICTEHFIVDICAYPRRIRWHGVLMLFAWVLFLPVGAMMPRHRCVHVSVCVCMCVLVRRFVKKVLLKKLKNSGKQVDGAVALMLDEALVNVGAIEDAR